jgi:hypothetical protein
MINFRKLSIKGLFWGLLTDVLGTLFAGLIFGMLLGVYLVMQGVSESELSDRLTGLIVFIPSLFLGLGFTVLGGYVAGRVSKNHQVLHGGIVGALGILFAFIYWSYSPLWYNIISVIAIIPAGMLGGYIATINQRK